MGNTITAERKQQLIDDNIDLTYSQVLFKSVVISNQLTAFHELQMLAKDVRDMMQDQWNDWAESRHLSEIASDAFPVVANYKKAADIFDRMEYRIKDTEVAIKELEFLCEYKYEQENS